MSRWLLALLFAFGTVTFLTGCPAEEDPADDAAEAEEGEEEAPAEGEEAPAEGEGSDTE